MNYPGQHYLQQKSMQTQKPQRINDLSRGQTPIIGGCLLHERCGAQVERNHTNAAVGHFENLCINYPHSSNKRNSGLVGELRGALAR
jgi:hypothetical protein